MKKFLFVIFFLALSCTNYTYDVDVLITGGTLHDGSGKKGFIGNIAVKNDTIFYVGKKQNFIAKDTIDASNKICLLYTSPSPRDAHESRMPSSA